MRIARRPASLSCIAFTVVVFCLVGVPALLDRGSEYETWRRESSSRMTSTQHTASRVQQAGGHTGREERRQPWSIAMQSAGTSGGPVTLSVGRFSAVVQRENERVFKVSWARRRHSQPRRTRNTLHANACLAADWCANAGEAERTGCGVWQRCSRHVEGGHRQPPARAGLSLTRPRRDQRGALGGGVLVRPDECTDAILLFDPPLQSAPTCQLGIEQNLSSDRNERSQFSGKVDYAIEWGGLLACQLSLSGETDWNSHGRSQNIPGKRRPSALPRWAAPSSSSSSTRRAYGCADVRHVRDTRPRRF